MSSGIHSGSAVIESYRDSDGNGAIARVDPASGMFGCAIQIRLVNCGPNSGAFWLARRPESEGDTHDYILLLPAPRWEQDARDAGWRLIQKLNAPTP